ncbi:MULTISPECIES: ketopantoate hydroxymethyltransferase [Clostridia]|uniref:ketopantoate hydroxymethyltransferase n=1 Tax=Clostridia TaxID=186801 RepID=UPI000EA12920|nr:MULTISPECIES: ketopantoate hydroxymethyltransferase [Clostridia]NBJ68921.1 ketopantoate hydroxymethyltransferase [Roseburia sp. 1XD42-34]RKI80292.1 ketopantoate hydroxymethyltransferase [Clostridium sp. 1xD42-85]
MIKQPFINDVARYIEQQITSVRLNNSYIINSFVVKEVQGCCVSMEILVKHGSIDTITIIDLLNEDGEVISTNDVVVPITSDTVILQSFEVREG